MLYRVDEILGDQKSTVAKKGKSPAFQRGLMNSGAGLGIDGDKQYIDI